MGVGEGQAVKGAKGVRWEGCERGPFDMVNYFKIKTLPSNRIASVKIYHRSVCFGANYFLLQRIYAPDNTTAIFSNTNNVIVNGPHLQLVGHEVPNVAVERALRRLHGALDLRRVKSNE